MQENANTRRLACALAIGVDRGLPTPLDLPTTGPFGYIRFHNGADGIALGESKLAYWAQRLSSEAKRIARRTAA